MIFYILTGLFIGFYIAMTSVSPIISGAKKVGIDNLFTSNTTLALGLNVLFLALIWPVLVPYFFSSKMRDALEGGFTIAIYEEDIS